MDNMTKFYVRDSMNRPIAYIVIDGEGYVGWSRCSKHDQFNKRIGRMIANNRLRHHQKMMIGSPEDLVYLDEIPEDIRDYVKLNRKHGHKFVNHIIGRRMW